MVWATGIAGLALYNWWVLVPFRPGLLRSPNELFSDLEVRGQPFASAMQHADLFSGLLLMAAFLTVAVAGARAHWGEWAGMMVSAAAGSAGGAFPEGCADGLSAVCHQRELSFSLAPHDYIHDVAGVFELAGVTVTLVLAYRRTRGDRTGAARTYRTLGRVALAAYPLLVLAYLTNRLGAIIEPVLFIGFTVIVVTQLAERTASIGDGIRSPVRGLPAGSAARWRPGSRRPRRSGRRTRNRQPCRTRAVQHLIGDPAQREPGDPVTPAS